MSSELIPPEMVLMMILDKIEKGDENMDVCGVPQKEFVRLVRHAIDFGYIREGTPDWPVLPPGVTATLIVPPIEPGSLTPRGKRYLDHLRQEFDE